ncbi:MAG: fructose-6-phosphate aldolase [Pyrinomonadaceae bacterium]
MKFFVDTANLDEIREAASLGLLDGVTTNPSLVAKEGDIDFKERIAEICEIVKGDVSAEVTALDAEGMLREGRELAAIASNVVIKCPLTWEGLKATKAFSEEGTKVNVTLCFSASQALLAAKAGAAYISPFIGRLDDISLDGMQLIRDIVTIYDNYGYETEVLAASIRHPMHIVDSALAGADVATIPFSVFKKLVQHPLTDKGLEAFLADWKASGR